MTAITLAARLRRIKPSPSTSAADRAQALQRSGRSIVNLVAGEPDFDTPAHIRAAALQAIAAGATRYTPIAGSAQLREAIAEKLLRENALTYDAREIIVTNGAKSAIYCAFAATLGPGDEVLIPAPFWVSYPDMVLACDALPVVLPCPEDQGFKLTAQQLEAAITPRTRWLLLNSPSNPTGACYTAGEYRALAQVLARHPQVMVMTDDIYEHIQFTDAPGVHLLAAAPQLRARTLAINGVSKSYAMTGWRIGYAAGPLALIQAMETLQSQTSGNACSVSQAAAVAALRGDQSFVRESAAIYRQRRDLMLAGLRQIPGLGCRAPDGAFYLFVHCAGLIGKRTPQGKVLADDMDLVLHLLDSEGVAVVAGSAYGLSPYFRLSIATSAQVLQEALTRIARAVEKLR
ncbi:aspartate transaminase [Pantoea sp. 18069]|uniref:aspartate transaminase n=1 Tax=Pantoea sp. 18069 TaxID=2681415 RepID=UPI00135CDDDF|nr:aspartate transaminase [Pantoea sp. 18069]